MAARRWNLPDEIAYPIFYHHQPSDAGASALMARVVDIADAPANKGSHGLRCKAASDLLLLEAVIALRLTEEQLEPVWSNAQTRI